MPLPSIETLLAEMATDIELACGVAPANETESKRLARYQCETSLLTFVEQAWPTVEPARQFKNNWHIGAVCEHLQALKARQIKNLLINQPPATSKSLVASVLFPAWCWTLDAWMRFLCLSYDQSLSTRDNLRMRTVVDSPWYQSWWPVRLRQDQNTKTRYDTTAGGWRIGTSMTGRILGEHPHGKIVDDPHNPRKAVLTELELKQATDTWDYGLSTRGATLDAWTILLMQRLHEHDLSGHVLANSREDFVHLCLPMRYEPPVWVDLGAGQRELRPRMSPTPLGWQDPRTAPGELLWPTEWSEEKVEATVRQHLGTWGESGQFQQRPAPAGGLMFQREWFSVTDTVPADVVAWVRSWDVAGTVGGHGARTAGAKMGRTRDGRFVIADMVKGRWSEADVERIMRQTAQLDGAEVPIREEQEPGSAGKAVVQARARSLAGYAYRGVPSTGDKITRARPLATQAEAGFVVLVESNGSNGGGWVREFLDEITIFPAGALKDQVDAAAGALNMLTGTDRGEMGLLFESPPDVDDLASQVAALKAQLGVGGNGGG
jgi:predicted phage terminase large subunit-like protein